MHAFLAGFGDLEIEERRPRSWNEPKIKRLAFAKNRRHVLDARDSNRDRIRNHDRRDAGDWAIVPRSSQQRLGGQAPRDQVQQWDNQRLDTQLRFAQQENRHEAVMNNQELSFQDMKQRQRMMHAQQLQQIMMQGQQFRQPMGPLPQHEMQHQRQPMMPPPPTQQHGPPGRGGHGGGDRRIQAIGPAHDLGGQHGGQEHDQPDDDSDDEFDVRSHHGRSHNGDGPRRGCHPHRQPRHRDGGHNARGGRRGDRGRPGPRSNGSECSDDIVLVESESDFDDHDRRHLPPRRILGGHGQRLSRVFRPRSHSRGSRHQSRSRSRRRPSRRRMRPLFSDDSDSDDSLGTHVRFARRPSRLRAPLRRARSASRGRHSAYDSDDSFEELNRRPRPRRLRRRWRDRRKRFERRRFYF